MARLVSVIRGVDTSDLPKVVGAAAGAAHPGVSPQTLAPDLQTRFAEIARRHEPDPNSEAAGPPVPSASNRAARRSTKWVGVALLALLAIGAGSWFAVAHWGPAQSAAQSAGTQMTSTAAPAPNPGVTNPASDGTADGAAVRSGRRVTDRFMALLLAKDPQGASLLMAPPFRKAHLEFADKVNLMFQRKGAPERVEPGACTPEPSGAIVCTSNLVFQTDSVQFKLRLVRSPELKTWAVDGLTWHVPAA